MHFEQLDKQMRIYEECQASIIAAFAQVKSDATLVLVHLLAGRRRGGVLRLDKYTVGVWNAA